MQIILQDKPIPVCHILLQSKEQQTYEAAFNHLVYICNVNDIDFAPHAEGREQSFVIDFETGLIPALLTVFPGVDLEGCLFHFTQANLRWVDEHDLRGVYRFLLEVFMQCM